MKFPQLILLYCRSSPNPKGIHVESLVFLYEIPSSRIEQVSSSRKVRNEDLIDFVEDLVEAMFVLSAEIRLARQQSRVIYEIIVVVSPGTMGDPEGRMPVQFGRQGRRQASNFRNSPRKTGCKGETNSFKCQGSITTRTREKEQGPERRNKDERRNGDGVGKLAVGKRLEAKCKVRGMA